MAVYELGARVQIETYEIQFEGNLALPSRAKPVTGRDLLEGAIAPYFRPNVRRRLRFKADSIREASLGAF